MPKHDYGNFSTSQILLVSHVLVDPRSDTPDLWRELVYNVGVREQRKAPMSVVSRLRPSPHVVPIALRLILKDAQQRAGRVQKARRA
jgi:hypothetical protein